MKPYPAYKDSGVEWLGEIPEEWDARRVRRIARIETGDGDTQDADDAAEFPFFVRSPHVERIDRFSHDTEAVMTAGDGAGVGKIFHHFQGRFAAHQRVYVISDFKDVTGRYFYYFFSSLFGRVALDGSAKSTVESLRRPMIADLVTTIPPRDEQWAIVAFLDRETAQIDELIGEQEALIEALVERRQSEFESAALATNLHRAVRLSKIARKLGRPAVAGAGVVTAYRDGQVTLRSLRRADGYTESADEAGYQGVRKGDVVFHGLDGFAGAVGVAESDGVCSPVYHVFTPSPAADSNFLADTLRAMGTTGQLEVLAGNVRQRAVDFRSWATFGALPIALPPIEEQRERHQRADHAKRTDSLIAECRDLITLLKERRSALISAAVTGKIDVRTA